MRWKNWLWLLAGTVLVGAGVTCAPVDDSPLDTKGPPDVPRKDQPPAEARKAPPGVQPGLVPPRQLPEPSDPVQKRIELALQQARERDLTTKHGFWTVFHAILGLGPSANIVDASDGKRYNALDYISKGGFVRRMDFLPTPFGIDVEGNMRARRETFVSQGHQDQFIAEMAQWDMPRDFKFLVNDKVYTFDDFVRHAEKRARTVKDANEKQELTWTIVVLAQYRGTGYEWTNERGEKLKFEDVVRYELGEDVENAACGGTHRLF